MKSYTYIGVQHFTVVVLLLGSTLPIFPYIILAFCEWYKNMFDDE